MLIFPQENKEGRDRHSVNKATTIPVDRIDVCPDHKYTQRGDQRFRAPNL